MQIVSTPLTTAPTTPHWTAGARIEFDAASCLAVRFDGYACDLCASACPVKAIGRAGEIPSLQGECIGCGQCAVQCPSGALRTEGFGLPAQIDSAAAEICIDCWCVPFDASPEGSLRVPCTGGIGLGWLLALCEKAGDRPVHILDRGRCGECPAGAGVTGLRATLTEARTLLFQSGVPMEVLPSITFSPTKATLSRTIPLSANEVRMGRRSFFRGLMGGIARGADQVAALRRPVEDDPIVLRQTAQSVDRLRAVTALTTIATRHGRDVPGQALPQLSVGDCSAHGICARVCPTGALVREESDDSAELQFFAARCIACGQCAATCPDKAIRVAPTGGNAAYEVLARWAARTCRECEQTFFGAGGDTCPACAKNQQLMQGVAALFQPRV